MRQYTEEDEELMVLYRAWKYANKHPKFSRKFVDDVYEFFEEKEYITQAQLDKIVEIYYSEKINEYFDNMEES